MSARSKLFGHSYAELTFALEDYGWIYQASDRSWRHPNGESVTVEAISDCAELWPALTGHMLRILKTGRRFSINIQEEALNDGTYMVTTVLEPIPLPLEVVS